jgi:hypothetical protein
MTAEQMPAGTTEQILRTWLATATPGTTYSLIYCPFLHEAMQSEHSMEHRRVWPLILGVGAGEALGTSDYDWNLLSPSMITITAPDGNAAGCIMPMSCTCLSL